jgi:hypothetical protein
MNIVSEATDTPNRATKVSRVIVETIVLVSASAECFSRSATTLRRAAMIRKGSLQSLAVAWSDLRVL